MAGWVDLRTILPARVDLGAYGMRIWIEQGLNPPGVCTAPTDPGCRAAWVHSQVSKLGRQVVPMAGKSNAITVHPRTIRDLGAGRRHRDPPCPGLPEARVMRWAGSHWGIENSLHWGLDTAFREDAYRIHTGHHRPHVDPAVGPQPAAPATTAKGGIAGQRKQAGRNGGYPLRDLSNWYAVALAQAAFI